MELYPENLKTMLELMDKVEELAAINGVYEVEIRARVDDVETWTVLGYGESGDPCVLRFEEPEKPAPPPNKLYTINQNSSPISPWASGGNVSQ